MNIMTENPFKLVDKYYKLIQMHPSKTTKLRWDPLNENVVYMGLYDYMASRGNMLTFLEFVWDLRLNNIVFKSKSVFLGKSIIFFS